LHDSRRHTEEEARRLEEEARRRAQEDEFKQNELQSLRRKLEEENRARAEQERRIRAEIEELNRASEEQRRRLEGEAALRAEAEARLRQEQERHTAEEQSRLRAEQDARLLAEEAARRHAEAERERQDFENDLKAEKEARQHEEATPASSAFMGFSAEELYAPELTANEPEPVEDEVPELIADELPSVEDSWMDINMNESRELKVRPLSTAPPKALQENKPERAPMAAHEIEVVRQEKGLLAVDEESAGVPSALLKRLKSENSLERVAALAELGQLGGEDSIHFINKAFDDSAAEVRNAAARALFDVQPDRAASFTRALREGSAERRRRIGSSLAESGLATQAINNLTGESRERTYDAFSLLFLMAKAGEVQPLMRAIEEHGNIEVRLAVVKLLALSGQSEIVPAFRRLAVRGSLPSEVRSAVMEAIYQISSQSRETATSAA